MNDTTYNGWTNRATWLVKLWIDNEYGWYLDWQERARLAWQDAPKKDGAVYSLAKELEEWLDEIIEEDLPKAAGLVQDLMTVAVAQVNWYEIAEAMIAEVREDSDG